MGEGVTAVRRPCRVLAVVSRGLQLAGFFTSPLRRLSLDAWAYRVTMHGKTRRDDADAARVRQALRLAARGLGYTHPNPMVGALVVRGGQVVGAGWHRRLGGPHAEVHALREAGARARIGAKSD